MSAISLRRNYWAWRPYCTDGMTPVALSRSLLSPRITLPDQMFELVAITFGAPSDKFASYVLNCGTARGGTFSQISDSLSTQWFSEELEGFLPVDYIETTLRCTTNHATAPRRGDKCVVMRSRYDLRRSVGRRWNQQGRLADMALIVCSARDRIASGLRGRDHYELTTTIDLPTRD